jgi:hypothetical protein
MSSDGGSFACARLGVGSDWRMAAHKATQD